MAKVTGHVTEDMVRNGRVSREDKIGNEAAGAAAELGRRHQLEHVSDVRRNVIHACDYWYRTNRRSSQICCCHVQVCG